MGIGSRARSSSKNTAVLVVCCVAQFMVVLDVSIVNVALPSMRHDLGLSVSGEQWVVNAYTLTFAGLLMLGGRAADLFGRRLVFMLGLGAFTVFSLLGGVAQNGAWLITARALQGVGGAVLAPATLSLLTTTFHQPDERRRAIGAWSATAASGAAVGVLLGGILTDLISWRWVLFVNVPVGVALLLLSFTSLSESRLGGKASQLDIAGAFTVTAGLSAIVYGVVGTDTHSWGSSATVVPLVIGALLLAAFVAVEARLAAAPLVPLGVFRIRSLSIANLIAVTVGGSLFGLYFFLSLYLQQINGYSALQGGLAFLPAGLMTMAGALSGARLVVRLGIKRQLSVGGLLVAAAVFWLSFLTPGADYWTRVLPPLVLGGIGFGWTFMPMTAAATSGLPPRQAGLASGLVNTSRQIGGAVGLAVMATVATSAATSLTHALGLAAAITRGYDRAFDICAVLMVIGAALSLLLPKQVAIAAAQPGAAAGSRESAAAGRVGAAAVGAAGGE